jgi:hypothetical protein
VKEGRGKLGKDFLHHVSPFLANYLRMTEKKQKNPGNCQMVSSAILQIRKKLLVKRRED